MTGNGRRLLRGIAATALVGVLGAGAAACGDDSADSAGGSPAGLTAVLGTVSEADAGAVLTYTDVTATRRLVKQDEKLYGGLSTYGIPEVAQAGYENRPLKDTHGFDENDVTTALQVGSDRWRLTGGFDVDAVTDGMKKLGYTESTTDGGALLKDPKGGQIAVSASVRSLSLSPDTPPPALAAPEKSVADDPAYQAVARCVGDATYYATFYGKGGENRTPDVTLYAIGATAKADGTSRERLCALTVSAEGARRTADTLRSATASGERFAGATVDAGNGDTPVVTMEWANGPRTLPGDQNRTMQLPKLLMSGR
ncbi:hypothetical protein AQF52_6671 [Streptomyces venezuelae]|uniref:hypothetical protein n=1 Tax=Streptomyces gardneri TaxID=66892 RepID=UPI0006BC30D8|nr:hypothetical protein [Streptomyces gardneri]ALO12264.1 hypothetical protein AQF52_6671 [Streptomyces venezuelae]QPK49071.1 hypothetical protein H4W23_33505 [Streptomyces gardneri]WRK40566.1 hypothetical protein U0M97_33665 [Streptomyces venezuelae]CUM37146.1 hypothetical protein BN2537_3257 [Streptomyces venezuelae]